MSSVEFVLVQRRDLPLDEQERRDPLCGGLVDQPLSEMGADASRICAHKVADSTLGHFTHLGCLEELKESDHSACCRTCHQRFSLSAPVAQLCHFPVSCHELCEAISDFRRDQVARWIEEHKIAREDFSEAISAASKIGAHNLVLSLWRESKRLHANVEGLGHVVQNACISGRLDVVQELVRDGSVSMHRRAEIMGKIVTLLSDDEKLYSLMELLSPSKEEFEGDAINDAAIQELQQVLKRAIHGGAPQARLVHLMWSRIPERHLAPLVGELACHEQWFSLIQAFNWQVMAEAHPQCATLAFENAAKKGDLRCIRALLAKDQKGMFARKLGRIAQEAFDAGRLDVTEELIRAGRVSARRRVEILGKIAPYVNGGSGRLFSLVPLLLPEKELFEKDEVKQETIEALQNILKTAIHGGVSRAKLVRLIWSRVPERYLAPLVGDLALHEDWLDLVDAFDWKWMSGALECHYSIPAIEKAVRAGNAKCIRMLLAKDRTAEGGTEWFGKKSLVGIAIQNGRSDIVDLLKQELFHTKKEGAREHYLQLAQELKAPAEVISVLKPGFWTQLGGWLYYSKK